MIPPEARVPCAKEPQMWDLPASVDSQDEAYEARAVATAALRICRTECPVRAECHRQAVAEKPTYRIQGGSLWTRNGRMAGVQSWWPVVRSPFGCGTRAAWERHKALGEDPCGPCTRAARQFYSDHKRRNKTRCKKGHEYSPGNTGYTSRGGRVCRTCYPHWNVNWGAA